MTPEEEFYRIWVHSWLNPSISDQSRFEFVDCAIKLIQHYDLYRKSYLELQEEHKNLLDEMIQMQREINVLMTENELLRKQQNRPVIELPRIS